MSNELSEVKNDKKTWQNLSFSAPITEFIKTPNTNEFIIRGTAISETTTHNNHKYIAEELERAAPSLIGRPLLVDHNNSVESIKGRVFTSMFDKNSRSIKFEAKVMDEKIKEMIGDGRITSVSIGAFAKDFVQDESSDAIIAKGIEIAELSLVAVPADENANFAMAAARSFALRESLNEADSITCPDCGTKFKSKKQMDAHSCESAHIPSNERRFDRMAEENTLHEMTALKEEVAKLREERKLNLINEYKKLCTEKSVGAKELSTVSEETIKMLIEQLKEIQMPAKVSESGFKSKVTEEYSNNIDSYVVEKSKGGLSIWAKPDSKGRINVKSF